MSSIVYSFCMVSIYYERLEATSFLYMCGNIVNCNVTIQLIQLDCAVQLHTITIIIKFISFNFVSATECMLRTLASKNIFVDGILLHS